MHVAKTSRSEQLLNDPIKPLILRLSVPTIIAMMISTFYNLADTYFVSRIGTSAAGATGIVFSVMMIIQAVAFTIGMGAGNCMSRLMGKGDIESASKFLSTGWFLGFSIGCIIAIVGTLFCDDIVVALGATPTIEPFATSYAQFIFIATPLIMCSFIMNNILRFQGHTLYALYGIGLGGLVNLALDPFFIFYLDMGTAGAGLATAIAQSISFLVLLYICNGKADTMSIHIRHITTSSKVLYHIFYTGMPSLARQGISSVSVALLNIAAGTFGDAAIAALSISTRFTSFIDAAVIGFGHGFQPVCSFNFGAQNYGRVKQAFRFAVVMTSSMLIVMCTTCFPFAEEIVRFFRAEDAYVVSIGTVVLQAQLITMPLWGFYTMSNMFTQSIGYGWRALLLAASRRGLFLIPIIIILPHFIGLLGIEIAQPLADVCSFVLAMFITRGILRSLSEPTE
ncbi:MAG: MATE family efflux transporter [Bacteroidales bacterium]|jgi:putative MATE family efflux protein|nr:MATE family efflux transporter [Bacteroidales bacterium]